MAIDPNLRLCPPPVAPVRECNTTPIFGAPRGRAGRNNVPIQAIGIHCIKDTYAGFISKTCVGSVRLMPDGHASFHYVLDAETGFLTSLVPEPDLAWSFQSYLSNFPETRPVQPPPCPDDCPAPVCPPPPVVVLTPEEAYPGWPQFWSIPLSADFYTINIGITQPAHPETELLDGNDGCCGPYGLSDAAYAKLVQLLAWIVYRYELSVSNIAFHDDIVATLLGCAECRCDSKGVCLKCDVSSYCQACEGASAGDPSFARELDIFWIYGESASGCKTRIRITDLKRVLADLP